MRLHVSSEQHVKLTAALRNMREALRILDQSQAPGEIGANLDLAIVRLSQILGHDPVYGSATQRMVAQLEREFAGAWDEHSAEPSPWEIKPF